MPKITSGSRQPPVKGGCSGSSCSIAVSDGDGSARWRIDVEVQTPDGRFRLGSVETVPPTGAPPKARVVAEAYCPGALEWYVYATSIAPRGIEAELSVAVQECCGAFAVAGVVPVLPFARSLDIVQVLGGGPATSGIISAGPARLLELSASSPTGGAATNLVLFDAVAVPGDGGFPAGVTRMPIPIPVGDVASLSPNEGDRPDSKGWFFLNGIVWASSSTYGTKTSAGAQALWVDALIRKGA